jgi:hypothetical protein
MFPWTKLLFLALLRLPPVRKAQWIVSRSWRRMGKFRKMLPSKC